jgi:hypothetical protein
MLAPRVSARSTVKVHTTAVIESPVLTRKLTGATFWAFSTAAKLHRNASEKKSQKAKPTA